MLVLDRKIHEGFWVGDRIYVKVLGIGRRRIKLGIEAPGDLSVVREELVSDSSTAPNGRDGTARDEQQNETFRPVRR